jgi:ATP-dependent helicase/nuclease subunit A
LTAARDGFFESLEVSDLITLLRLLDNPLQDIPLLAVLRSPLVGLSLDELAQVRSHNAEKPFWTALMVFQRTADRNAAWTKIDLFARQFTRWRELVRQASLSQCLETVLTETHYEALLLAGPRGEERGANLRRLLNLARQFDPYQRQGLYRFLRFVEAQADEDLDLPPALPATADAVRLMSVHKSKGLEFPIVALAGLGTRFNEQDLNEQVLLSERYGLCPKITPPEADQSYPGLPYWLARRSERRELRGEELRLFYVALTRARDALLLVGTAPRKASTVRWSGSGASPINTTDIVNARSHLDWLLLWLPQVTAENSWSDERQGHNSFLRWQLYDENDPVFADRKAPVEEPSPANAGGLDEIEEQIVRVTGRLAWTYPFPAATVETAKTSVSVLRRRQPDEGEGEAKSLFPFRAPRRGGKRDGSLSAAEIGSAHHLFLQLAAFDRLADATTVRQEVERLRDDGSLTVAEAAALDVGALASFWQSVLGQKIRAQRRDAHREIPFTARFSAADLAAAGLPLNIPPGEFVVVQGVADLAVILPGEIWLVDFKTDELNLEELDRKAKVYQPQLTLYALALSRIYRRPVTECHLHFLSPGVTVPVPLPG